ncbi:hypothetical protein GOP47_0022888 [Adiantum capillus-veneris]|uniref:Uncharacterized protein n=1 Tax=Adiantum capillus-veneris TaxID=13818 RepID=A0A9D4Z5R9_ADICA|nr:hypothetical protein GOP47_0022888 [Adiantum capillus-veneris]
MYTQVVNTTFVSSHKPVFEGVNQTQKSVGRKGATLSSCSLELDAGGFMRMRLRERKQVNYDVDDSDEEEEHVPAAKKSFTAAAVKPQDTDTSEDDDLSIHEEEEWLSDDGEKGSDGLCGHGGRGGPMLRKERGTGCDEDGSDYGDEDDIESDDEPPHHPSQNRCMVVKHVAPSFTGPKTRINRTKLNYNEDSVSESSSRDLDPCEHSDAHVSELSSPLSSDDTKGKREEVFDPSLVSSRFTIEDDIELKEDAVKKGSASPRPKYRRRLIKLSDRSKASSKHEDAEESHLIVRDHGEKASLDRFDEYRYTRGPEIGRDTKRGESTSSECISDLSGEIQKCLKADAEEIAYLAYVYVRKRRSPKGESKERPRPDALKEPAPSEWKVDVFGLYSDGEEDSRPIVKRVGLIEKILSVKNKGTDAAMYCVKLNGKSYRNVAYVCESLLSKGYSNLLRHFWRRMDDLGRFDGNVAEKEDSPAFNPDYIKVDRIMASEQRGRKKFFLVKWQGLPYSESTWEAEDALIGDKFAMKRFLQISAKGAPSSNSMAFLDGRTLRDYQRKGLAWMDHNFRNHVNCILADEMGLGKTIQSVAMLQNLRVKWKMKGPFLVVAPVSTLGHWQREIESLTDMNCLVYSGSMDDRNVMREYDFYTTRKSDDLKFNVLLTGYEVLMKDHHFLSKQDWQYIIVDEAHRLKTKQSKTSRTLKEMSVRKGGLLLLTGTPVQNNTKEIFSLLNMLDPEKFKSEEEFLSKYGDIRNAEQVRDLQENILKPRLLRRMKEDVEKSIPLKEETIIWVELTKDQRSYYKAIYENRIAELLKGSQNSNLPNLRNVAMELRKLCNHPFLCDGLEEHLTSKTVQKVHESPDDSPLCQNSGKMLLLDKLLPKLKDAGRRVLIFSQFTMMLDLLEDYLNARDYSYERIDGKIRGSERQAAIDRYSARESKTFVFLLSTRAGGLGITLTAADTCVIYDSDWNPQNDLQAMARCHRIGQTKDVKIYRLITRNTYEQHLFECSSRKYGLDEAILGNFLGSNMDIEHTKNIETLLKRGAYDMLKEDGEAEAAAFHAQNIDQILEQRTQQRLIGGRGNNTFSVATFVSNPEAESEETEDAEKDPLANMDSSQFWQELLPEAYQASLVADKPQAFISTGPRRRAQVNYKERKELSDDEGSSDEEVKAEGRKRHKRDEDFSVENELKQWTEKELKRLENRLIMLGKGREEKIMVEAELDHHGVSEVQQVAEMLIQLFHFFDEKERRSTVAKESEPKSQEQDIPQIKDDHVSNQPQDTKSSTDPYSQYLQDPQWPKIPSFAQKVISSPYCLLRIQKNASRYLQALHERDVLSKALSDVDFSLAPVPRSKKLPFWWGDVEDLHLMKGALKHGHKEFVKIREDPSFCFLARMNALKIQEGSTFLTDSAEAEEHDSWPHDSVLIMRLKKIIEYLPNGLSDREIKRRAAVAEAARRRWLLARQGQEMAMAQENLQRGFIVYVDGVKYEQSEGKAACDMPSMGTVSTHDDTHQMQRPFISDAHSENPVASEGESIMMNDEVQISTSKRKAELLVADCSKKNRINGEI